MKIEIEITDADFQAAAAEKVKAYIKQLANSWEMDNHIRAQVESAWKNAATQMVLDAVGNLPAIREAAQRELTEKIKKQLSAAMKVAAK